MPTKNQPDLRRALLGTFAAALLPGTGHLVARRRSQGLALLLLTGGAVSVAALHLLHGLTLFESSLGGFLFPVLLRSIVLVYGFSVLDAYVWLVDPDGTRSLPGRRQAVFLNLLVPGTGYLVARAWIRAATGLALLALILFFARAGRHPHLDLIYVGVQLVMGIAVYHQMSVKAQQELDRSGRDAPELPRAPGAQVVVLLALTLALVAFGYVVQQAMPGARGVTAQDLKVRPTARGVQLAVPRLGMSMTASGAGWTATANPGSGFLFSAQHKEQANLRVGMQPLPNFVRLDRYLDRIRGWMEETGLEHQRTKPLKLNGVDAVQMFFTGKSHGVQTDRWAVTIPSPAQKIAFLVLFECRRDVCKKLESVLERTRDSFKLTR